MRWCSIPYQLYTTQKLTPDRSQRDCGCEIHPGVDGGICATIIDLGHLMDPVAFLLLFNVAVWLYWTVR
jgi:hypothetical protein